MINGSTQILGNISGRYLNPLMLVESQASDNTGFVMVMYEMEPRRYDLLFLHGRTIIQCARMNQDLRFLIDQQTVTSAFNDQRESCTIFLFQCDEQVMARFIETFHAEPCLKVHVDALSKPQLSALLKSTGCQKGIIERNDFTTTPPSIELVEISSSNTLPNFKLGLKRGRLLVYDLMKNEEIQSQRFGFQPFTRGIVHPVKKKRMKSSSTLKSNPQESSTQQIEHSNKSTADAVFDLVQEILGTQHEPDVQSNQNFESKTLNDEQPNHEPLRKESFGQNSNQNDLNARPTPQTQSTLQTQPEVSHASPQPPQPDAKSIQPTSVEEILSAADAKPPEPSQYVRSMERLLRSFRQQVVEICTQRAESIFAKAEKKILMLNPDFDHRELTNETAIVVLELIDEMIREAPFLKRSKLRDVASELISDLYNKQYELLEQHKAVDAVEQSYYRLKGSK